MASVSSTADITSNSIRGPSNADFSFGVKHGQDDYHRIWALNDGCLRFVFEPRDTDLVSNWPRQAACLLLEVESPLWTYLKVGQTNQAPQDTVTA